MKSRLWWAICLIISAVLLMPAGCARRQIVSAPAFDWHSPDGAYIVDGDPVFYAVGEASGVRNTTLLRATADNQAQTKMARIIRSYLTQLSRAAGLAEAGEQDLLALSELVQAAAARARIVRHRHDTGSGTLYAQCRLELSAVQNILAASRHLEPRIQEQMLARSAVVHARMISGPAAD